jgi:hypothetical protein
MRRLLFAVVVVGVVFNVGVSFAQERESQQKVAIKKVIENETQFFLERDYDQWANSWVHEPYISWSGADPTGCETVLGWEPLSKRIKDIFDQYPDPPTANFQKTNYCIRVHGKMAFVTFVEDGNSSIRVLERHGKKWKLVCMNVIASSAYEALEEDIQTDTSTTREDFEEFCRLQEGRWICDITWAADWTGFGKKGDKVTAYAQWTLGEDGNALIGKFHGGNGSDTKLVSYDANAKQINSMLVDSTGYVEPAIIYKSGSKWIVKGSGSGADGKVSKFNVNLTFTDNSNTLTVKGTVWMGDKEIDIPGDVWRKVSK